MDQPSGENSDATEESPIKRVLGMPLQEEQEMLAYVQEIFQQQEKLPYEREKTPEELEIIRGIIEKLPDFLAQFGLRAMSITPDHIHVADEATLTLETRKRNKIPNDSGGFYMDDKLGTVVFSNQNPLVFAGDVVHEILHLLAFNSLVPSEPHGEFVRPRRIGFQIIDRGGKIRYFHEVNEAITEELARIFDRTYFAGVPPLKLEVAERNAFIKKYPKTDGDNLQAIQSWQNPNGTWTTELTPYAYRNERKNLKILIDDIAEKNKTTFPSWHDVAKLFVEAAFTGRLLPVARAVEKSFGKGSFRMLAEKTAIQTKGWHKPGVDTKS